MFHSNSLYSLINWGRASNFLLREIELSQNKFKSEIELLQNKFKSEIELLQNKFIRACLFQPRKTYVNLLFSKFLALKLKDMINMEFAKFMYKYENHMLPSSFDNYFIKLESIHTVIIAPDKRLQVDFFIARLIVSSGEKDCIIFA